MWMLLTLLTGLFFTAEGLAKRYVLRAQTDVWAFSFFYSLVGTVITLPFIVLAPTVPTTPSAWTLTVFIGALIVANNWLLFKASAKLEASLVGSLHKLRLVWIYALGLVFLHETFSLTKFWGTLLTVVAGLVIIHGFRRPKSMQGAALAVAATFFNAAIIIVAKHMLGTLSVISLTFFGFFLVPLIINFICMPRAWQRITALRTAGLKGVLLACTLGALANLTLIGALSLNDATSTVVITEAFLILILVGEHVILKEKEYLWVKLVSVILAIGGAILIQLS
jgi:drug/metabolite transporter (DMT)-like permease